MTPHLSLPNYWILKIDFHNVLAVMNGNIKIKKSNCSSRTLSLIHILEYPLELHRKVKKYAVDAGMKEKQVIAQAIRAVSYTHLDVYKRQILSMFPL